jgi:hypothetical protein
MPPFFSQSARASQRHHLKPLDSLEIPWVAGVDRQAMGECDGGDHGIERPGGGLASRPSEGSGHEPEGPGCPAVEGDGLEGSLYLLEMDLPGRTLFVKLCHERADAQLGQGDGGDQGLPGKVGGIFHLLEAKD